MSGNALISDQNFKVVDVAIGTSTVTKIFGFGGLNKDAMVFNAKQDLYLNYPLKKGQALANVTVDFSRKNYIVYEKVKVTISAEIIDFSDDTAQIISDEINKKLSSKQLFENKEYLLNEKVYAKINNNYYLATITRLMPNKLSVQYEDNNSKIITKIIRYSQLFKINKSDEIKYSKYKVGETIVFKMDQEFDFDNELIDFVGKIVCIGYNNIYMVEYYLKGILLRTQVSENMIVEKN